MHVPGGPLDATTATPTRPAAVGYGYEDCRRFKASFVYERVLPPVVLSAAMSVAQALNWPLPGGASPHFAGGASAGVLLSPLLGLIPLAPVVGAQCALLHDGGIAALGANLLNVEVIGGSRCEDRGSRPLAKPHRANFRDCKRAGLGVVEWGVEVELASTNGFRPAPRGW